MWSMQFDHSGKSKRHYHVRNNKHLGISSLTGKDVLVFVKEQLCSGSFLECYHIPSIYNFSIVGSAMNNYILEFKESHLISRDERQCNKNILLTPFIYLTIKYGPLVYCVISLWLLVYKSCCKRTKLLQSNDVLMSTLLEETSILSIS